MRQNELVDVTFLVGEWMPILELADMLEREQAHAESPEPPCPRTTEDADQEDRQVPSTTVASSTSAR